MIRDVAWRGESPYLVPAAKVEAITAAGSARCSPRRSGRPRNEVTKPRAMSMRLSGADGRSPPFTRPSRSSGPLGTVSVKQRPSARGCVSFQRGEHLLSGTPEHTFPRCGRVRPYRPWYRPDAQAIARRPGARRAASLSDGGPCGANRQQADLAVWSVVMLPGIDLSRGA